MWLIEAGLGGYDDAAEAPSIDTYQDQRPGGLRGMEAQTL